MTLKIFGDLLRPKEAADLVALSCTSLARARSSGKFVEGIHYCRYASGEYRYFSDSLYHWAITQQSPEEHQQWIKGRLDHQSGKSKSALVPA